jgi:hypothetical protein
MGRESGVGSNHLILSAAKDLLRRSGSQLGRSLALLGMRYL